MTMPTNLRRKIVELPKLLSAVEAARAAGRTVVQCHGCFDIVHPGHIRYLEFARRQGDVLIVTLTGDSLLSEDDSRPYIPQDLRAESLAALMFVDHVHVLASSTAESILAQIQPDIYVKGREYEHSTDPAFLAEKSVVEGYGGRIIFSSGEIDFSSTDLIGRVGRAALRSQSDQAQSHRLEFLTQRHDITARSIEETLDRFADLHVLIVGDIVIDRYVFCDVTGVASEAPMMSLVQRDERTYVGGAAIVARHVAALGAHAFLLSACGSDERSRMVADILDQEGVEAHLIPSRPTIVEKTRFLADETKLFKVDRGEVCPLDSVAERRAALLLEQQSKAADAVIFCDFGYGMITGGLLARILPTLRHNVRTLAADVSGGRANLLNFRHVDLLCPTERELRATLNDYDSGLSAAAWEVLQRTQARHLIVTLEKRGMVVFERPSQDRSSAEWSGRLKGEPLPSFADYPVDRLGCGDAMLAAGTLSLAAGRSLMHSAYLGNAAAAVEISMLGNHPLEVDALRAWTRKRRELAPPAPTQRQSGPDSRSTLVHA